MIKFEHIETCNWEAAIRSMRNAYDSWALSDSGYGGGFDHGFPRYILGPKDRKLALTLAKSGTDHGKYLRSIIFSADITAPMYWWKEMDTYKVGTVRNSCSTMHTVMKKPFTEEDFSWDQTIVYADENDLKETTLELLNHLRDEYLYYKTTPTKDVEKKNELMKKYWYTLIQLLPSSYNQRATWTGNYAVLRNIYHSRNGHPLSAEWGPFCAMIEKLPYSELITEVRE